MAHLLKPDIQAVLTRTHLPVSTENFLLPTYEAISNAVHSIQEKWGEDDTPLKGHIIVRMDRTATKESTFRITDNGIGLYERNFKSFRTPFSGYKLKRNRKRAD